MYDDHKNNRRIEKRVGIKWLRCIKMARKKEISKGKILDTAYKMAIKDGIEGLTARSIAKAGHFSTQPLYLEFDNMVRYWREFPMI